MVAKQAFLTMYFCENYGIRIVTRTSYCSFCPIRHKIIHPVCIPEVNSLGSILLFSELNKCMFVFFEFQKLLPSLEILSEQMTSSKKTHSVLEIAKIL